MIYALLLKNAASRIYLLLWAKSLRMPGLGNACILGKNGPETLRGVACVYHVYNVYHVYINMLVYISRVSV